MENAYAGANQVVIKIRASELCYTDVHITHGMIPTQFPGVLGHEPVGEIVENWSRRDHAQGRRPRRRGLGAPRLRTMRVVPAGQKELSQNGISTGIGCRGATLSSCWPMPMPPC